MLRMAKEFIPLRFLQSAELFKDGDILVVFGEVFSRGYVNGLIEEAKARGMNVVFSTVGRRDDSNELRALTEEELNEKEKPILNVLLKQASISRKMELVSVRSILSRA